MPRLTPAVPVPVLLFVTIPTFELQVAHAEKARRNHPERE
jgi:hypothetical protein